MNNNTNTTTTMPEYVDRWTAKMVEIWRDRLDLLGVYHTGNLRQSVTKGNVNVNGLDADISFQFLRYGIYVDRGVGNGYTRGNGGDLAFLGKAYRMEHKLGRAREKRPWFSRSWYISTEVMKDYMAQQLGSRFRAAFDNL